MAQQKNLKADKPMYANGILWDGNLSFKTNGGVLRTIRTDLGGLKLRSADQNKEIIVLMQQHAGYNELDHGYIVRTKQYDDGKPPYFGLKETPDALSWGCYNYCDVIAWGYADGGLNDPTLFYSCQSTVAEEMDRERRRAEKGMKTHAEQLAEMEAENDEWGEEYGSDRRCVKLRDVNGEIQVFAKFPKDEVVIEPSTNHAKGLLHECAKNFDAFRKQHPEVTEMHYYTDEELAME